MKSILLSSALVALLTLTGCSTKEPTIDVTDDAAQTMSSEPAPTASVEQTETIPEDVIAVDENGFANADSNEMTMSGIERKMQAVNFDFDKFNIRPDMQDKVVANAKLANVEAADYSIKLEGNCDEWGSDEYNYALGLKRANSVKTEMINNGVDAGRITMVSYGESNPLCTDKTQECWSQNRRVDFKLLP
jgi:peptidoglycan-associated lipoprotein